MEKWTVALSRDAFGPDKADRIQTAWQSHISTFRGEAFVTAEEGGNCRLFRIISQKSSFLLGPVSLFPVQLNDVRPWTLHGWGEQQPADLQQRDVKMASTLNNVVRWNQFDRDLIWSGSGGVHMVCWQSGKQRLMRNSVATQPPRWVWACGAPALLGEVFHLVPNKGRLFSS